MSKRAALEEKLEHLNPEALFADGFDDALVGIGQQFNSYVVVYDRAKCIQILMDRDGMDREGADEFFDFNVVGAYLGEFTPVFLDIEED